MARVIPAAMARAMTSGAFHRAVLMQVDWPVGDPVRVHTGVGPLTWDGHTWTGVGGVGFIELPPASRGIAQEKGQISFGGSEAVISAMLGDPSYGAQVQVWLGCLTGRNSGALVSDPVREFVGTIDDAFAEVTDDSLQGYLGIVSGPPQLKGGSPYHTLEDQKGVYPTDTLFRWIKAAATDAAAGPREW